MKGRKPTRQERKILQSHGYDTYVWLVQMNNNDFIQIVNRETQEEAKISKCGNMR